MAYSDKDSYLLPCLPFHTTTDELGSVTSLSLGDTHHLLPIFSFSFFLSSPSLPHTQTDTMPSSLSSFPSPDLHLQTLLASARPFLRGELEAVHPKLPSLISVLRSVGAGECWHKHGSFLEHLFDMYKILKLWKAQESAFYASSLPLWPLDHVIMWFFCVIKWLTFGFLGLYLRYYLKGP